MKRGIVSGVIAALVVLGVAVAPARAAASVTVAAVPLAAGGSAVVPGLHSTESYREFTVVRGARLARIVRELDLPAKDPRCYTVHVSQFYPRWGVFSTSAWGGQNAEKCRAFDGTVVIKRTSSGWVATRVGGSTEMCSLAGAPLNSVGAPGRVQEAYLIYFGC